MEAAKCSVEVCDRPAEHGGLCHAHYERKRTGGRLDTPIRRHRKPAGAICKHPPCERPADGSRGYCTMHYQRERTGRPLDKAKPPPRTCTHGDCTRPYLAKGLCSLHYARMKSGIDLDLPMRSSKKYPKTCKHPGCERVHFGLGYCKTHYYRQHNGRPMDAPIKKWLPVGSRRTNDDGYVEVKVHTGRRSTRANWVKEHRHVMAGIVGRPLQRQETVHHKNGDRADNRPENLELWSRSHPPGQRVRDKVKWAKSILAEYGELVEQGVV